MCGERQGLDLPDQAMQSLMFAWRLIETNSNFSTKPTIHLCKRAIKAQKHCMSSWDRKAIRISVLSLRKTFSSSPPTYSKCKSCPKGMDEGCETIYLMLPLLIVKCISLLLYRTLNIINGCTIHARNAVVWYELSITHPGLAGCKMWRLRLIKIAEIASAEQLNGNLQPKMPQ